MICSSLDLLLRILRLLQRRTLAQSGGTSGDRVTLVARAAEDKVDSVRLASRHQLLAGKARIGRCTISVRGHRVRIWATIRAIAATAAAEASMLERRSLAASKFRP